MGESVDALESNGDLPGSPEQKEAARWREEIKAAQKGPYKRWIKRAEKAIQRYRDEDPTSDEDSGVNRRNAQFNVLWSNIQITAPAVYARPPVPIAERRYMDQDIVGRAAATIAQRALSYQIEESELHQVMMQCRTDYMLAAHCEAWVQYVPTIEEAPPGPLVQGDPGQKPTPEEDATAQFDGAEVSDERLKIDYVHWSDGLVSTARFWQEIRWRARAAYFTRKMLIAAFGPEKGKNCPLELSSLGKKAGQVTDAQKEVLGRARVWQIWDLEDKKTVWFCEAYEDAVLKEAPDLLNLRGFAPAARPARGTTTNDSIWPIPDYTIYFDQARELDSLTSRIAALTRAIKACGVFDQSFPELQRLFSEGMENKLIGTKNWAKLSSKGGLQGAVSFLPIKEFAEALIGLYNARTQVKQDLYEISGTSDILRGATNANETLGAQKLKSQFSSVRLADRRDEFNRFVRDTMMIMGEIVFEWFHADTIWKMCDFEQWAKEQDLREWALQRFPPPPAPMMGHNGGPPLDDAMMGAPVATMGGAPEPGLLGAGAPPMMPPQEMPAGGMSAPPAGAPAGAMGAVDAATAGIGNASPPMAPPMPGIPIGTPPVQSPPSDEPMPAVGPKEAARALFDEALALLRKDKLRSFRLDIETDSTIQPDVESDKAARVEFVGMVTQFLAQGGEMMQTMPQMMPVLGKLLLFGVRGFRVGRDLESSLEQLIAQGERTARNPPPQQPSPEQVKAEAAKALAEQKGQLEREKMQGQMAADQQKHQLELQKLQAQIQADREKMQLELQKMQAQLEALREKNALQAQQGQIKTAQAQQQATMELQTEEQRMAMEGEQMERQAEHDEERMERESQHDERSNQIAIRGAEAKAKAAAQAKPANGGRAR